MVKLGNGLYQTIMNNPRTASAVQEGDSAIAWGDQSSDRLGRFLLRLYGLTSCRETPDGEAKRSGGVMFAGTLNIVPHSCSVVMQ